MPTTYVRKDLGEWYYKIEKVDDRNGDKCMQMTLTCEVLAKDFNTKAKVRKVLRQLKKQMRLMMKDKK